MFDLSENSFNDTDFFTEQNLDGFYENEFYEQSFYENDSQKFFDKSPIDSDYSLHTNISSPSDSKTENPDTDQLNTNLTNLESKDKNLTKSLNTKMKRKIKRALEPNKKIKNEVDHPFFDRLPSSLMATELQNITSQKYQMYLDVISSTLSTKEMEIARSQKRRIKNRESAYNSRMRKQDDFFELKNNIKLLNEENQRLKTTVQSQLDKISYFKSIIQNHLPKDVLSSLNIDESNNCPPDKFQKPLDNNPPNNTKNRSFSTHLSAATLFCLVLFFMSWGANLSYNNINSGQFDPFQESYVFDPMNPVSSVIFEKYNKFALKTIIERANLEKFQVNQTKISNYIEINDLYFTCSFKNSTQLSS